MSPSLICRHSVIFLQLKNVRHTSTAEAREARRSTHILLALCGDRPRPGLDKMEVDEEAFVGAETRAGRI